MRSKLNKKKKYVPPVSLLVYIDVNEKCMAASGEVEGSAPNLPTDDDDLTSKHTSFMTADQWNETTQDPQW